MGAVEDAINTAYPDDAKLKKRIFDAINETPQHGPLFMDLACYQIARHGVQVEVVEQPASKKRKLENGVTANGDGNALQNTTGPRKVILEVRDVSFQLPQRKKFHLSLVQYGEELNAPNATFALAARNPATNAVEFEYPMETFAYVLRVPVPEKAQKSYNFCFLPSTAAQPTDQPSLAAGDGVVWSINHGPLKSYQIYCPDLQEAVAGPEDVLERALAVVLEKSGQKMVLPNENEFASAIPEAIRKHEKAYHVKAHRGSKDGYLFFLEDGIFFGFKKPLMFFPFHDISSVSYTAVLQRTFNLVITVQSLGDGEPQEIEFAMLDQADFTGIDAYIKNHQLQDASMADARRAKQHKVNETKTGATGDAADDGKTELERAEAELQDEEDELEEDYDPGSDGESEGEGSSSDDEGYAPARGGRDLVADELGSEAEDVEVDDDDGEEGNEEEDDDEDENEEVEQRASAEVHKVEPVAVPSSSFTAIKPDPHGPDIHDEDQL